MGAGWMSSVVATLAPSGKTLTIDVFDFENDVALESGIILSESHSGLYTGTYSGTETGAHHVVVKEGAEVKGSLTVYLSNTGGRDIAGEVAAKVSDKAGYGIAGVLQVLDDLKNFDPASDNVTAGTVLDKNNYRIAGILQILDDLENLSQQESADAGRLTPTGSVLTGSVDEIISATLTVVNNILTTGGGGPWTTGTAAAANSRIEVLSPAVVEIVPGDVRAIRVFFSAFDENNEPVDTDSTPSITVTNAAGVSRDSNFSGPVIKEKTGVYYRDYSVADDHEIEGLIFTGNGFIVLEEREQRKETSIERDLTSVNLNPDQSGVTIGSVENVIQPVSADVIRWIGEVLTQSQAGRAGDNLSTLLDNSDNVSTLTLDGIAVEATSAAISAIVTQILIDLGLVQDDTSEIIGKSDQALADLGAIKGAGFDSLSDSLAVIRVEVDTIVSALADIAGGGFNTVTDSLEKIRNIVQVLDQAFSEPASPPAWDANLKFLSAIEYIFAKAKNTLRQSSNGNNGFQELLADNESDVIATSALSESSDPGTKIATRSKFT